MRRVALIYGALILIFFALLTFREAFQSLNLIRSTYLRAETWMVFTIEDFLLFTPVVIALAGCIVFLWREGIAGSLLILAYFVAGFSPAMVSIYWGRDLNLSGLGILWWIIHLPYLFSGILFFVSRQLSKKPENAVT